ncbi:MAG: response regulator transcription factor [Cyanobacteria bacterium RUI128]|nr:response regulator transcription factor [Cyanobacteria bacterium RUI128]
MTVKTQTIKVIIVEDFKLTRVGLRCALNENKDIEVIAESDNAYDGLKLIEKLTPDVVLMDLGLSGMNGIEAIRKIEEMNREIKVIALTSHDRVEEVIATLLSGATGYCLKDIDPQKLADVIRDVNTGVCWLDAEISKKVLKSFPKQENFKLTSDNGENENKIPLTEREQEVLKHLVAGKSNTEIAKELIVSVHTAKAHVCSILQKMCVNDRVQAAVKAVKEGLV